ncbi:MAG: RNA polymerase sigma factor [Ruminococcaceae bacterium]|nr:RNA polymerase sigma factor [Oscillospiraceae bacterium]
MEDNMIVELYFERDERAIAETERKYDRYLTKIAFNILSDTEDSRESVNDTYLAAWNSIPPNKPSVLSTYLGKLTRRISIDLFRKRNTQKRKASEYSLSLEELSEARDPSSQPEKEIEDRLLGKAISDFLRTLSNDARDLFIIRYYYLDSLKDAAKYCNMTESRAKSLLFRTRCSLKEYLIKEGFEL